MRRTRRDSKVHMEMDSNAEETSASWQDMPRFYKLYLGWQHFSSGKYKVVPGNKKKGSGQKLLELDLHDANISVKTIIEKGTASFFPKGICVFGNLKDMNVSLANSSNESIESLSDAECTFLQYLKTMNMNSSTCTRHNKFYIRTKFKTDDPETVTAACAGRKDHEEGRLENEESQHSRPEENETKKVLLVNGKAPGKIILTFRRKTWSKFSNTYSTLSCTSMRSCYKHSTMNCHIPYDQYNCITHDGFNLTYIEKLGKIYLRQLADGTYKYKNTVPARLEACLFLRGPCLLHGVNECDLILGVLTHMHDLGYLYRWFKDDEVVFEGINACTMKVSTPGSYTVGIVFGGQLVMCDDICRVEENLIPVQTALSDVLAVNLPSSTAQTSRTPKLFQSINDGLPIDKDLEPLIPEEQPSTDPSVPDGSEVEEESASSCPKRIKLSNHSKEFSCNIQDQPVQSDSVVSSNPPNRSAQSLKTQDGHMEFGSPEKQSVHSVTEKDLTMESSCPQDLQVQSIRPQDPDVQMTSSQDVPQQTVRPGAEQEVLSSSPETTDLMDVNVSNNSEQDLESQNQPLLNDKPEGSTIHETDVNENECLILPRVALTDLALGEEIARGTFGKVRRAQWLGTDVAVKETDVKRMKFTKPIIIQELKIHSKIRHPNIIQLMAYTTEKNKLYMILELNDGKNLEEVIFDDHEGIIPLDIKMEITRSVIKAVAYLHNQSPPIIHMDIKPENVLVSRELKRIRLCNLGISKLKTMNSSISTSMGSLQPGTLAYQAPEVFMNQSSATSYSDIWSTGCTILELFTEMPAWSIPPDDDLGAYILTRMKDCNPPDAMQAFLSIFPENCKFKEIIRMALSYDAKNRPSALELLSNCCL